MFLEFNSILFYIYAKIVLTFDYSERHINKNDTLNLIHEQSARYYSKQKPRVTNIKYLNVTQPYKTLKYITS